MDDVTVRSDIDGDGTFEVVEAKDGFDGNPIAEDTPVYDLAGNLTYDGLFHYRYDAWNRQVAVNRRGVQDGTTHAWTLGAPVAAMAYDGLGRRISKTVTNCGDWDCAYQYYHDGQRLIEERGGSQVLKQNVWGLQYIDELVQIGLNQDPQNASACDPAGQKENLCERFFWVCQDANFNVQGVLSATGMLVERYEYTPYGQRTVFSKGWLLADMNDDGVVDVGDLGFYNAASAANPQDPASRADFNGDGVIDVGDLGVLGANYGRRLSPADPLVMSPRLDSFTGRSAGLTAQPGLSLCDFGHQGLRYDREFGLYDNRARTYGMGRFMQRDPLGYVDGMNLYQYCRSAPSVRIDPFGTSSRDDIVSMLTNAQNQHSGQTYYKAAGVDQAFRQLWWALGQSDTGYMVLGAFGSSQAMYWSDYNLIKIRRGTTDSNDAVHELVHALDDQKGWYITSWTAYEPAEALAYGTERLLAAANGLFANLDDPKMVKDCRHARDAWDGAWKTMSSILEQNIEWSDWSGGAIQRRLQTAGDIWDVSAKMGMRFSCSMLKPLYEEMLYKRGIRNNILGGSIAPGLWYMDGATLTCPCLLKYDFKGWQLDPVFK